ncbi:hypothetical protein [Clostridium culturomicium]|uniref:hypothetical protein n=1 Tax=Clostridium culturomicium TaxID=1499683 RepID=UPI00058F7B88|nr:hypothetical protein [Clostridium culturomicium]
MTNQECMADLERITEISKLKEQQAILKEEYIILKMKEESSVSTYRSTTRYKRAVDEGVVKTAAEVAKEYMTIEEQINQLEQ